MTFHTSLIFLLKIIISFFNLIINYNITNTLKSTVFKKNSGVGGYLDMCLMILPIGPPMLRFPIPLSAFLVIE